MAVAQVAAAPGASKLWKLLAAAAAGQSRMESRRA
jgi:hypothetical protein